MAMDTRLMDTLPQHVHDELRSDLNTWYAAWRQGSPDGDIIDGIMQLPRQMYWAANYDANSEHWRAWVDFWIWFTNQNRLVAEAGRKETRADE